MTPPLGYLPFSSVRGVLSPLGLAIIDYDRWLNRDGSDDDDSVLVTIAEPDHVERAAQACTLAGYHCWSAPRRTWPDEDAVFQLRVTRRRGSA